MGKKDERVEDMPEELDATFQDEQGRRWFPRLTLPMVDYYCRENGIGFGQFDGERLSQAALIDLCYAGIKYQTLFRSAAFSREQFLEALDGPSYTHALLAAQIAIANFTLRSLVAKSKRASAVASVQEKISAAKAAIGGGGPTSSGSAA